MAIVNVTPDSFFDGGRWMASEQRSANASVVANVCRQWVELGVDLLDVGGESTRPGATPVDEATELMRVLPVLDRLRSDPTLSRVPISIDTRHAKVAAQALEHGAAIVNDVSGLADPAMAEIVAAAGAGLVIGHLRGEPATMQQEIRFDDLLGELVEELGRSLARARAAGVGRESIVVDPCVGFGKTAEQSAALVAASGLIERELGCPVLIGASRKGFLGALTGKPVEQRMLASVVAGVVAVSHGARILRVHDVAETLEALKVVAGIEDALAAARGGATR